ncbi:MAG TPA: hypothetical protein VE974_06015 [Thermoanaerobaculia bacterium]|nr:hypothetical protein [Thermoanaerobaculia bacterium]
MKKDRQAFEREITHLGDHTGSQHTGPRATFIVAEILLDIRDQNERIIELLKAIEKRT